MYSIEHIQAELDKVFIECGYKVGEAPFEDGDWREFGATGEMIIKYCQKLNINCYVHHGRNLLTYMAPEDTSGMAIVNVRIWGDHVYFYGSDEVGRCEMNRITSTEANKNRICNTIKYKRTHLSGIHTLAVISKVHFLMKRCLLLMSGVLKAKY